MTIRLAAVGDGPELVGMAIHFLESTPYGRLLVPSLEQLEAFVALILEIGECLVAEEAGALVGMLAWVEVEHPVTGQRFADEQVWWVEHAHRKSRAGYYLLRSFEDRARQKQLSMVKLSTPSEANHDTGRFLRRLGYEAVEIAWQKGLSADDGHVLLSPEARPHE